MQVLYFVVYLGHAFNQHDRCVCAGYDNGDVKLFDLRAMSLRWETNVKNGVCRVDIYENTHNTARVRSQ